MIKKYLHIGQHWATSTLINNEWVRLIKTDRLESMQDVELLLNEGKISKHYYSIKTDDFAQWGSEVYAIDENNKLSLVNTNYDSSD